jgi:hypothetical protein
MNTDQIAIAIDWTSETRQQRLAIIKSAIEKAYQQGRKDGGDAACAFTRATAAVAGQASSEQGAERAAEKRRRTFARHMDYESISLSRT